MRRERPVALLIDLDGVLRRWDPEAAAAAERRHGLPAGVLRDTAFAWSLLQPAITGQLRHADWMAAVVDAVAEAAGGRENAQAAVDEWQADRGSVDPDVLAFVRQVRSAGVRVGLATNATDLLDADLKLLGLTDEVDVVVNSSTLGVPKPAKEYFQHACVAVGAPPSRVLFVDDEDRAIRGARVAGLSAYRWNGPDDLRYLRAVLAL
ncbi:HAD-IA family hydrolase [Micromonospora sp. HM5-17]|jgi:putative hydrolase of the HAD superfamily|uniref:HAD-IA family hydrolase n=1 Tax=Micromonospora sp. HM5-17 TaxID=2487710 RepID=UPI000F4708EC|nr:HAD-IA family hydrolase [Micromonospora sp. HM5-17]ROT32715.1 HAD family hydrolase [Micromonospora sp. HM5-17]